MPKGDGLSRSGRAVKRIACSVVLFEKYETFASIITSVFLHLRLIIRH